MQVLENETNIHVLLVGNMQVYMYVVKHIIIVNMSL